MKCNTYAIFNRKTGQVVQFHTQSADMPCTKESIPMLVGRVDPDDDTLDIVRLDAIPERGQVLYRIDPATGCPALATQSGVAGGGGLSTPG